MRGLIIKKIPLEKILSGQKTWEMRGKKTERRGTIALIEKGTGQVVGTAELKECIGPLTSRQLRENMQKHQADEATVADHFSYKKNVYAWALQNAKRLRQPVHYTHPPGAVIWVNLDTLEQDIHQSASR